MIYSFRDEQDKLNYTKENIIPGLEIFNRDFYFDDRGYISTFYQGNNEKFTKKNISFVEDKIAVSAKNVLRGLHGDFKTWKLVSCLQGECMLVVVDCRLGENFGNALYLPLSAYQVLVPPGCVNGHFVVSPSCMFHYKLSEYYTGPENQFTIKYDDPELDIRWPNNHPTISERDKNGLTMREFFEKYKSLLVLHKEAKYHNDRADLLKDELNELRMGFVD